jgi:hypothetical protein
MGNKALRSPCLGPQNKVENRYRGFRSPKLDAIPLGPLYTAVPREKGRQGDKLALVGESWEWGWGVGWKGCYCKGILLLADRYLCYKIGFFYFLFLARLGIEPRASYTDIHHQLFLFLRHRV